MSVLLAAGWMILFQVKVSVVSFWSFDNSPDDDEGIACIGIVTCFAEDVSRALSI